MASAECKGRFDNCIIFHVVSIDFFRDKVNTKKMEESYQLSMNFDQSEFFLLCYLCSLFSEQTWPMEIVASALENV